MGKMHDFYRQLKESIASAPQEEFEESQTQPDMSLTPRDIITRYLRGQEIGIVYHPTFELPDGISEDEAFEYEPFEDKIDAEAYMKEMREAREERRRRKPKEKPKEPEPKPEPEPEPKPKEP